MLYAQLTFLIFSFFASMHAMEPEPKDCLGSINYVDAFNQKDIHERFSGHLYEKACGTNVFGKDKKHALITSGPTHALITSGSTTSEMAHGLDSDYENACLEQLQSARHDAITARARESSVLFVLQLIATYFAVDLLGGDSFGGSFGIFNTLYSSTYLVRDVIRSAFNVYSPPAHPLNALEESFAVNQCFIPKDLWAIITEKFMLARQNQFQQREGMNFLEFALGLTIYKPHAIASLNEDAAWSVTKELHARVDFFFKDYETGDGKKSLWHLKINIHKFIQSLLSHNGEAPRYIGLYGPGGIGKTRFVNDLCTWIEQLMANSVHFENLVISSAEELEGSAQRPGAFLRVVRNQLMANKRGSLVLMDEATWLNKEDMISPAKRTFNGDQSRLSTSYFGDGVDGTGITLELPPMLMFVALNEKVADKPLRDRFDFIEFPLPSKEALSLHAQKIAWRSSILARVGIVPHKDLIELWISYLSPEDCNFRYIAANVEEFLLMEEAEFGSS